MNRQKTGRAAICCAIALLAAPCARAAANTPARWYYFKQSEPYSLTNVANYSINSAAFVATNAAADSSIQLDCGKINFGPFDDPEAPLLMDGGTLNASTLVLGQDNSVCYVRITNGAINLKETLWVANGGTGKVTMDGGTLSAKRLTMKSMALPAGPSVFQINGGSVEFTATCDVGVYRTNILAVTGSGTLDFDQGIRLGLWDTGMKGIPPQTYLFVTNGGLVRINGASPAYGTIVGETNAAGHIYIADGGVMTNNGYVIVGDRTDTSGSGITVKDGGKIVVNGFFNQSQSQTPAGQSLDTTTLIDNGTMEVAGETQIGRFSSLATLIVTNGGNFTCGSGIYVGKGEKSEGFVAVHNGATLSTTNDIIAAQYAGSAGTILIDGGSVTSRCATIGYYGAAGLFVKNGGKWFAKGTSQNIAGNAFNLGSSCYGEIGLSGGEIVLGGPDDTSAATIQFCLGCNSGAIGGLIHGWGAFTPYDVLVVRTPFLLGHVNSMVVADGEGQAHDLSLFKMQLNAIPTNLSPSNGWYAARKGRLRFPYCKIVPMVMGGSAFIGAGNRSVPDPVRVNSVCVTNMGPYQVLFGDLYAPDRADIPAGLPTNNYLSVRSVWRIGIAKSSAYWKEEKTLADSDTFTNEVSMFFRYNAEGFTNSACGLAEAAIQPGHSVRLWRYDNTAWKCLGNAGKGDAGIIQVDHVKALPLTENSPSCFGWFAVTVSTFRGTVIMLK